MLFGLPAAFLIASPPSPHFHTARNDSGLLDLNHAELEVIFIINVDPVLVLVHDLYDWLGDTLLSGKGGDSILELLEACWGLDALDSAGALAFNAKLDLDIDVGVVSSVLSLHGHLD